MKFLEDLQNSDAATKRKWLVFFTVCAMAVIIFAWVSYFNALVMPAAAPSAPDQSFTFGQTLRAGLGVLWQSTFTGIKNFGKIFTASRTYQISP